MRRASILVLTLLALGAASASDSGAATPKPALQILKTHRYGNVLVAGNGFMVYGFSTDKRGVNSCQKIHECLAVWPPVLAPHTLVLGSGVKRSLVHSIRLSNGKRELTYNGWPLYLYTQDPRPRYTGFINLFQFGGFWPAINSAGKFTPAS